MSGFIKEKGPGILLALLIAVLAYFLGKMVPVIGGPVIGITLGILVGSVLKLPTITQKGLKFTSKYILQLAVILLGFEMNMTRVIQVGRQSIAVIFLTLTAAFLTSYFVGKRLQVHHKLATLIGVGTAICGGSAIAAAAPAIEAEDQDVSFAISTIFLFNIIAVFLFPFAGHLLHMSDSGFGMWAGTAINDTSSVVAAGYSYSDAAGNFATIVKLTRSLMIVPITLALALITARNQRSSNNNFQFVKVFPWFVVGFLLAAVVNSLGWIPANAAANLVQGGKFFIIMAMAAIGLNTNLRSFVKTGPKAILLGAATWLAVLLCSLGAQLLIRVW
jgi:Predicted membrane protein